MFQAAISDFQLHFTETQDNLPYEKVGNSEPVCITDEVPFEIPESWEWVRVRSLGSIIRGSGIKRTETVKDNLVFS